jgi:alanyl-tRNA synthetase
MKKILVLIFLVTVTFGSEAEAGDKQHIVLDNQTVLRVDKVGREKNEVTYTVIKIEDGKLRVGSSLTLKVSQSMGLLERSIETNHHSVK